MSTVPGAIKPTQSPSRVRAIDRLAPLLLALLYTLLAFPALYDVGAPIIIVITGLLGTALVWLSIVDIRTMRLPDAVTMPLAISGVALAWVMVWDNPFWRLASAAIGYLVLFGVAHAYRAIRGRAGLGLGDAKLFAAAGAWLGMGSLPSVMLWACMLALAGVLLAVIFKRRIEASTRLPFGPFLALGVWMVWLYGPI
jgi:leader peptidase (prepilin peptidase) / N-methyltransferase